MSDERDPQEAVDEIREKAGEGEEPDEAEREFLESEHVPLDPGEEEPPRRGDSTFPQP